MWSTLYDDGEQTSRDNDEDREHVQVELNGPDESRQDALTELRSELTGDPDEDEDTRREIARLESPEPLAWANHANIFLDRGEDSVTVTISVSDPRGSFGMTIRRVPDGDGDYSGQLIMHVPYEGMTSPHMPLKEIHPGTFVIGKWN